MAFIDWGRWAALNKDKGEEMASKTLDEARPIFDRAEGALAKTAAGRDDVDASAINVADAKRKALQGLSGIAAEKKNGADLFDSALQQGSQTMGNAYSQMGDYQKRLETAQGQGAMARDRRAELARRHALAQVAQTERNQADMAKWEADRKQRQADEGQSERFRNHTPLRSEQDEYLEYLRRHGW
jgi:chromosome segregation ATPase